MAAESQIAIAVMGATGSGKSSFLSNLTGNRFKIGHSLYSETADIQLVEANIVGHQISLIDTPGFNDTKRSDTEILRDISTFLAASFQNNMKLSGLIYMHRITDNRVGGVGVKNLIMFRKLCGQEALKNVVLCTTMWDLVDEPTGARREGELRNDFWRPMVENGSQVRRHDGTAESAMAIIRSIIPMGEVTLRIQDELVTHGIPLAETAAGREVNADIERLLQAHREDMKMLRDEMRNAHGEQLRELQEAWSKEAREAERRERERAELLQGNQHRIEELAAEVSKYTNRGFFSRLWHAFTGN